VTVSAILRIALSMHIPHMALTHQKLIVYQKALDVMVEVLRITRAARPGWSELCNQVKRAATSVALNIGRRIRGIQPGRKSASLSDCFAFRSGVSCRL
jgi:23S rRNA-intervening sequence protein